MSEITAIRKGFVILAVSAAWLGAALLLWRTSVPSGLDLPELDARDFFSARELARHERYERFLRALFVPAVLLQGAVLVGFVVAARRLLRRLPFHPVVQGVLLAFAAAVGVWLARLPVGVT